MVSLYDKIIVWSQHKHAPRFLAAVSFVEASLFPIPPYVMLAPMALAKPKKAVQYALIATVASVCGGLLGYLLGYLIFKPVIFPLIERFGYVHSYQNILNMFDVYGFVALLILGVTPVPYKLVAIGSGFLGISIPLFVLTSFISRGLKFLAVAVLIRIGGPDMQFFVRGMLERFGILTMSIFGLLIFFALKVI